MTSTKLSLSSDVLSFVIKSKNIIKSHEMILLQKKVKESQIKLKVKVWVKHISEWKAKK